MHVAGVEKLLGIHMSEDYGIDDESDSGSARALSILNFLSYPISQAQIAAVERDLELPNRLLYSERMDSHVKERENLSEDTSLTAAGGDLDSAGRGLSQYVRALNHLGRHDLPHALRTDCLDGLDEPRIRAESRCPLLWMCHTSRERCIHSQMIMLRARIQLPSGKL